jgi:hypothetical protein
MNEHAIPVSCRYVVDDDLWVSSAMLTRAQIHAASLVASTQSV